MADSSYHGMPHQEIEKRTSEVPADPRNGHVYKRVVFSGNFGFGCLQFQRFVRSNMTESEAQKLAWSAFGKCGYDIRYYDAKDREMQRTTVEPFEPA